MHGQARRAWVPCLIAAAFVALAGGCAEETNAAAYDLSGRVVAQAFDGDDLTPLGDVRVVFTSDTGRVAATTTGDDGRYEMQVLSDFAFGQVRAERRGFTPSEHTVYFDRPERRIDFVLRPAAAE